MSANNSMKSEGGAEAQPSTIKALSVRQPWAWLIVNGHKDIENRNWKTRFRGQVLIHASKGMTKEEYDDVAYMLNDGSNDGLGCLQIHLPDRKLIERGGIVGICEIVDCVTESDSMWYFGNIGFVIRNARPLPFVQYKGQLGFFDVSRELVAL